MTSEVPSRARQVRGWLALAVIPLAYFDLADRMDVAGLHERFLNVARGASTNPLDFLVCAAVGISLICAIVECKERTVRAWQELRHTFALAKCSEALIEDNHRLIERNRQLEDLYAALSNENRSLKREIGKLRRSARKLGDLTVRDNSISG